ncbi:MAG: hypothetical protein KAT71_03895 [Gammaproteobacteria bacterium]|nr:hypothetical protein [Gammaproteobacteria bacterium]
MIKSCTEIFACSLVSSVGNQPEQVLAMIKNHTPASEANFSYTLKQRVANTFSNTLTELVNQLPEDISPEKILLYTLLPSQKDVRSNVINQEYLSYLCSKNDPVYMQMQQSFSYADKDIIEQLKDHITNLRNSNYELVIFGGVDVDIAAYVLLRQTQTATRTVVTAIEPINNIAVEKINNIILAKDNPIEWAQVTQKLWPFGKYPEFPQEIETKNTLGDMGTATLPMHLALATKQTGNTLIYEPASQAAITVTTHLYSESREN